MTFNADKHWQMVLDTPGLAPIAYEMAQRYFKKHHTNWSAVNPTAFTIPLEDEETEAAFAAAYAAEPAKEESESPPG